MKIEKVNDNQIRCTLTKEDLASRELKISELAYGTEKAKNLFRDMMQQANFEFGFEAEDIPLMIEAIPLNAECIVLIITKVEDPEELDTRFSRFAPHVTEDDDYEEDEDYSDTNDAHEVLDLFRKLNDIVKDAGEEHIPAGDSAQVAGPAPEPAHRTRIFTMNSLNQVMEAADVVGMHFKGQSSLYKDERTGKYLLMLTQGESAAEDFDRASNMLSEYGSLQRTRSASPTFLEEHCEILIAQDALKHLTFHFS